MYKYYGFLILIVGMAVLYVFVKDPCKQQLRAEFADMYPSYVILDSAASEGSPESVRCRISYQKPEDKQIYEELWLYQHKRDGWSFSRILETHEKEQAGEDDDKRPRNVDREAKAEAPWRAAA
jgi:hypothetical protein